MEGKMATHDDEDLVKRSIFIALGMRGRRQLAGAINTVSSSHAGEHYLTIYDQHLCPAPTYARMIAKWFLSATNVGLTRPL